MVESFTEQMRVEFGIEPFDYAQGNYLIADSALYTAETLSSMSTLLWISRVPETLNLARDVIDVVAPGLMRNPAQTAFRRTEVEYGGVKPCAELAEVSAGWSFFLRKLTNAPANPLTSSAAGKAARKRKHSRNYAGRTSPAKPMRARHWKPSRRI